MWDQTSLRFSEMPSSPIYFYNLTTSQVPRNRIQLKKFLAGIFKSERKKIGLVNYIFCLDKYLLSINREYLQHDEFTDTISFTFSGRDEPLVGEVYISIERIRENASLYNTTIGRELHRVIFHSTLHLCGHEDNSKEKKKR